MNKRNQIAKKLVGVFFMVMCSISGYAQNGTWYGVVSAGAGNLRNFTYSMYDAAGYSVSDEKGNSIDYKIQSNMIPLVSAGVGLTGKIDHDRLFEWDVQANVKTAGYQLQVVTILEQNLENIPAGHLPQLGSKSTYRYWAVHAPISVNYHPFTRLGFKIGADLQYQLSNNPASDANSGIRKQLGTSHELSYQYPFNLGAHVGFFVPFGNLLRVDVQAFSDLTNRLTFRRSSGYQGSNDPDFREMGMSLSLRYKFRN